MNTGVHCNFRFILKIADYFVDSEEKMFIIPLIMYTGVHFNFRSMLKIADYSVHSEETVFVRPLIVNMSVHCIFRSMLELVDATVDSEEKVFVRPLIVNTSVYCIFRSMLELADATVDSEERVDQLIQAMFTQAGIKDKSTMTFDDFCKVFASEEHGHILKDATIGLAGRNQKLRMIDSGYSVLSQPRKSY